MFPDAWAEVARAGLAVPAIATDASGAGVRVAVVDSGVNFDHPHLVLPDRGFHVAWEDGVIRVQAGGHQDRLGHGTCCAALIHLLAPDAELLAIKVTGDGPTTDADRLAGGIRLAATQGATLACVALGTKTRLGAALRDAVEASLSAGLVVVAADPGEEVLPAACAGAIAVGHLDGVDVVHRAGKVMAEGRARPAGPGRGASNFWGPSLAAARATAAAARHAELTKTVGEALREGFPRALDVR